MKTKTLSILLMILALPAILSTLFICMLSFDYWIADGQLIAEIISGKGNYKVLAILTSPSVIFLACFIMYLLQMIKYGSKIDNLEEEIMAYFNAKEKYERAVKMFKEKFLNDEVKSSKPLDSTTEKKITDEMLEALKKVKSMFEAWETTDQESFNKYMNIDAHIGVDKAIEQAEQK